MLSAKMTDVLLPGPPKQRRLVVLCCRALAVSWIAVIALGWIVPARAQQPPNLRYRFAIGDPSRVASSGEVWLYSYSWYGLQKLELASIAGGVAEIGFDTEKIQGELKPHPNTDAYVVALQFPNNLWYRTPDISPDSFWKDFREDLAALGQTTSLPSGEALLVLPAPTRRRITLLHEDGRPVEKARVPVSIYLYDTNHCGRHTGLPLGDFLTDDKGTMEVLAPTLPLYLDVHYYGYVGTGPAGREYEINLGLKTGAEENLVIQHAWELPDYSDLPEQEFELRILTTDDLPRPNISIHEYERVHTGGTCGAWDGIAGETDSHGVVRVELALPVVAGLELEGPSGPARKLSPDEMRTLSSEKRLTLRW